MSDQHQQSNEQFAADLLRGAEQIRDFLNSLGFNLNVDGVYYAHRAQLWPISKHGKQLIASKAKLTRYARRLVA